VQALRVLEALSEGGLAALRELRLSYCDWVSVEAFLLWKNALASMRAQGADSLRSLQLVSIEGLCFSIELYALAATTAADAQSTGAAGAICYSLIFMVASGALFGPRRRVALHLLVSRHRVCGEGDSVGFEEGAEGAEGGAGVAVGGRDKHHHGTAGTVSLDSLVRVVVLLAVNQHRDTRPGERDEGSFE